MRLEPSDPDIETVVTRIERGDLDLQPAFQRGEVWSKAKKQRLIDSVLRDWHVPPIHVIELKDTRKQEVLDGQQRLAAIRDFVRGDFGIDGGIEPFDEGIASHSGKKFRDLPDDWKRRFNQFTIRIIRIVDYRPEEPGELFFRLNQPSSLTAAEQRNAFFGPVRAQIKSLTSRLEDAGVGKAILGFSNARMAYDDVLARVCFTVSRGSLTAKVTASELVERYRSEESLPPHVVRKVERAIQLFSDCRDDLEDKIQLNKATVYSWFLFAIRADNLSHETFSAGQFSAFMLSFENSRQSAATGLSVLDPDNRALTEHLIHIFTDRSTSRVADVASVMLRDAVLWIAFEEFASSFDTGNWDWSFLFKLRASIDETGSPFEDDEFARRLIANGWGNIS